MAVPVCSVDLSSRCSFPAGDDLVTFHYRPPHLAVASVLSLGASALLVLLLVVWLVGAAGGGPAAGLPARESRGAVGPRRLTSAARLASAVRVGQREEELAVLGAPHPLDHEAGGGQLALDPLGRELGADLGEQILALVEADGDAGVGSDTSVASSARSRISIHCSSSFQSATCRKSSGSKSPPSWSLRTWSTFRLKSAVTPAASS